MKNQTNTNIDNVLSIAILDELTEAIIEELSSFQDNLLKNLDSFESQAELYKLFTDTTDSTLVSEHSLQLIDMLKDIKLLARLKSNELACEPKGLAEIALVGNSQTKIQLRKLDEEFKVVQRDHIEQSCIPLTNNPDGYTLVETLNFITGKEQKSIISKPEQVYKLNTSFKKQKSRNNTNDFSRNKSSSIKQSKLNKISVLREYRGSDLSALQDQSMDLYSRSQSRNYQDSQNAQTQNYNTTGLDSNIQYFYNPRN